MRGEHRDEPLREDTMTATASPTMNADQAAWFRDTFDRFLLKFPLYFAYWGKYAQLEFNIAGPESAEMVR